MSTTTPAKNYSGIPTRTEGAATPTTLAPNSDADCSTEPPTSASPHNPTEEEKALPTIGRPENLPHVYGVHPQAAGTSHPMPIYLGAQNTTSAAAPHTAPKARPAQAYAQAYDPAALLRHLILLWALLLGLTLWLGGWQPHTSDARLGWSTGTIHVVEGTDGDTGSKPASPNDEGLRPASDLPPVDTVYPSTSSDIPARPVEMGRTFFEGSGPAGVSISPWSGGSEA